MAAVLGISADYHDAAAALVVDGVVVAAMQEERLSRIKNDPSLPVRGRARVPRRAPACAPGDLDAVVFYENPYAKLERVLVVAAAHVPAVVAAVSARARRAARLQAVGARRHSPRRSDVDRAQGRRRRAPREPRRERVLREPVRARRRAHGRRRRRGRVDHGIWRGDGDARSSAVASIEFPHSLGLLYAALTAYLGFEVNEGEYKVMGLAAFGTPRFRDEFAKLSRSRATAASSSACLLRLPHRHRARLRRRSSRRCSGRAGRRAGPGTSQATPTTAATPTSPRRSQAVTEDALLALARAGAARAPGCDAALPRRRRRAQRGRQRAAAARGRLRARLRAARGRRCRRRARRGASSARSARGDARPAPLADARRSATPIDDDAARELARRARPAVHAALDDVPAATVAALLARGEIVAFAQRPLRVGPARARPALDPGARRATPPCASASTARSSAASRSVRSRPPCSPSARASWFDGAPNDMTPFMTTVCTVRRERRAALGAVTHVDGTARVQTVTETSAPELHAVLARAGRRTGAPVVLNTSLNGPRRADRRVGDRRRSASSCPPRRRHGGGRRSARRRSQT